jgi:pimeloyl-ACP methyl ester carboxylesterase
VLPNLVLFALGLVSTGVSGQNDGWRTLALAERAPLAYRVVVPDPFDATEPHPVLLALPPGGQDRAMVDLSLQLYFESEACARGWIVVAPAAPDGSSLHEGGAAWVVPLLDELARAFVVEGRVHLAGVSNGGRSAFRVAAEHAGRFESLSVLPGMPDSDDDRARLAEVASLPVSLFVGGADEPWLASSRDAEKRLRELGARDVRLTVVEGQGHQLQPSVATELFDRLDELRARALERAAARAKVADVLDALHAAAATADEERYFDLFAPGAIFIGTDASERWTLPEFRAFAEPYFQEESAWVYELLERHVDLSADGALAWFDERLVNASYGETRGSGVLVRAGGRWRIAHYVLSFPIPNDVAREVVEVVKESAER